MLNKKITLPDVFTVANRKPDEKNVEGLWINAYYGNIL